MLKPILFTILLFAISAQAQFDISNQITQSGRYELKKGKSAGPLGATQDSIKNKTKVLNRRPANDETVKNQSDANEVVTIKEQAQVPPAEVKEPSVSDQAKSLFTGGYEDVLNFYKESIHPEDVRNNKIEFSVTTAMIYNDSNSNYSFRNYKGAFPSVGLGANVWLTPSVGVGGKMGLSMGASVAGDSATRSMVPVRHEEMEFSYKMRKFQGLSRKSNSLECSILYSDFKFDVSTDSLHRPKLRSSGIGFGIHSASPSASSQNVFIFGGTLHPRLQHVETKTGAVMSSGSPAESIRVSFDIGGEYRFARDQQVTWMLNMITERNLFDGTAGAVDPESGKTPTNVAVTNSSLGFRLGYKWGK